MKIEQYLAHTDYALWEVILNGNGAVQMTKDEADEHLARYHEIKDAKTVWDVIKSRFDESISNTNELNVAYSVSIATGHSSQAQEEGTLPRIVEQSRIQGTEVEMLGMQGTKEEIMLDEALREKDDLKAKLEKFDTSSKNLTKLLNSQISAKVKTGLAYDSQFNENEVLDVKEEEVTKTVFDNRSSDEENSLANDWFKKGEGYHAIPPPLTENYMPPKPDLSFAGLDDSIYKFKISETVTNLTKDVKDAPETSTATVEKPKKLGPLLGIKCTRHSHCQGEGSDTPTEPHHTPFPMAQPPSHTTHSSSTLLTVTTTSIHTVTPSETTPIRQYTRRARIAQSSTLPTIADEPESLLRDVSQGEACPTDSGFIADQNRATIAKSSTLPHALAPRVTSPTADEGSMQQTINELTALCTSLQRQYSKLAVKFKAQEIEITRLNARVKLLEDRDGGVAERSRDDAPIKGRNLDKGEAAAERASDDTEEMATVLTSMDAATVLASGAAEVPTGSDVVPTASPVFATATVITPYRRRKGKEQIEDFIPMGSKEEAERFKRKGTRFEQESTKKLKPSEEVTEEAKSLDKVPKEKVKEMMQLVPIEEVYVEALQVKHLIIDWMVHTEGQRSYWKITRLGGSSASYQFFIDLLKHLDEPNSPLRDFSQGEAYPTDSGFIADQDRATIDKSSTLPHDSAPRVTSPIVVEGKDREGVAATRSRDDAPIKGRSIDEGEAATERISDDLEEMATVLTFIDVETVLASGVVDVPTGSGSIPTASTPAEEQVPTRSDVVPTASLVFATATVVTPYRRRKGKEVMVESETPKKQKVQEQIDAQVARELEEQLEREDQRRSEQIARDAKIARIHAEEEIPIMINGLDRNNETSQQRKPWTKKQKRDYYMAVIRSNLGWKRLVKETLSNRPPTSDKQMELWVELSKLYEQDHEDQLWTHTQNFMHAPVAWKLYDSWGVHHVISKDKEFFMLEEKDYPLRKGLALVMISYKLQVENYSQMVNDLILKIRKIANSPRQQGD
nr:hypothetical protein [Tanacetum cinerariifolium]